MNEKVLWYSLSVSAIYSMTALFFSIAAHSYKSQEQMLWECPFAFLTFFMTSLPLLLVLSCPGPPCMFLCRISHSEALKEWAARSWESCTAYSVFLGLHEITDIPVLFIASIHNQQQNCYFNQTQIIHLNSGDGLEQDMLQYHESKYLSLCAHTKWCPRTRYSTLSWV